MYQDRFPSCVGVGDERESTFSEELDKNLCDVFFWIIGLTITQKFTAVFNTLAFVAIPLVGFWIGCSNATTADYVRNLPKMRVCISENSNSWRHLLINSSRLPSIKTHLQFEGMGQELSRMSTRPRAQIVGCDRQQRR
jgi:hypothetical protein